MKTPTRFVLLMTFLIALLVAATAGAQSRTVIVDLPGGHITYMISTIGTSTAVREIFRSPGLELDVPLGVGVPAPWSTATDIERAPVLAPVYTGGNVMRDANGQLQPQLKKPKGRRWWTY